ncbi:MAG: helix-turn-helix transcriptional regulator [Betaproteobacteria bacterium]|nr:MAG: helix-turn-helix transcriptional regulator [Betaproteobacteria bacterium]
MSNTIVDQIYEAAFVPEQWSHALQSVAAETGCASGVIATWDAEQLPQGFRATPLVRPAVESTMRSPQGQDSRRFTALHGVINDGFTSIDSLLSREAFDTDPIQVGLRALGLESQAATAIPMPSGELVCISFERRLADGPFDERAISGLNELRPHLARAGLMAARLGLERAQTTVSGLRAIGLPAVVLTLSGRVLATNDLFDALPSTFLPSSHGGLAINDVDANRLFQASVSATRSLNEPLVRSIPIVARDGRDALVVHVLPLRRAAHEIFSGGDLLVVATTVRPNASTPSPSILMGLFDLTPSEVKLAVALASGNTVQQAASEASIRLTTARTYLDRIFRKTGTHQQSQLVALLKSTHAIDSR